MARTPISILPPVQHLPAPCPLCQGQLSVYLFVQATDWANVTGGLELTIQSHHLIGPHACYPAAAEEDDDTELSIVASVVDGGVL